jgi:hypothetical protein
MLCCEQASKKRKVSTTNKGCAKFDLHAGLVTSEGNLNLFSNLKLHDKEMLELLVTAAATDSNMLQTDGNVLHSAPCYRQRWYATHGKDNRDKCSVMVVLAGADLSYPLLNSSQNLVLSTCKESAGAGANSAVHALARLIVNHAGFSHRWFGLHITMRLSM